MKIFEILAFLGRISFDFKEGVHKSFLPLPGVKMATGDGVSWKKNYGLSDPIST